MDDQKKIDWVDRYLQQRMSPEELRQFELLLKEDKALFGYVEVQKRLIRGIERYRDRSNFVEMLQEFKREESIGAVPVKFLNKETAEKSKVKIVPVGLGQKVALAASIAIIITVMIFLFRTKIGSDELFASYFDFYPDVLTEYLEVSGAVEDANIELHDLLETGINAYNTGQYNEARILLEKYIIQNQSVNYPVILSNFYLAQIALADGQTDKAIKILEQIKSINNLPIESAVTWYLSLAYLQKGDIDIAAVFLENLKNDNQFGAGATQLLNQIR